MKSEPREDLEAPARFEVVTLPVSHPALQAAEREEQLAVAAENTRHTWAQLPSGSMPYTRENR